MELLFAGYMGLDLKTTLQDREATHLERALATMKMRGFAMATFPKDLSNPGGEKVRVGWSLGSDEYSCCKYCLELGRLKLGRLELGDATRSLQPAPQAGATRRVRWLEWSTG